MHKETTDVAVTLDDQPQFLARFDEIKTKYFNSSDQHKPREISAAIKAAEKKIKEAINKRKENVGRSSMTFFGKFINNFGSYDGENPTIENNKL